MPQTECMRLQRVDLIPAELQEGVLYVSGKYRTAVHLCCCGCRSKVVTPLKSYAWTLTTQGDAFSLRPSIGNWNLPCRSHYWIIDGRIKWGGAYTEEEVREAQLSDRHAQERYFDACADSLWARFGRWLKSLWQ